MLLGITILKALLEVAALTLLGQGVLYLLAGARREQNLFYQAMGAITRPLMRLARLLTPRRLVLDQHIGLVAFLLVAMGWYFTVLEKQSLCTENLADRICRPMMMEYAHRCVDGDGAACDVLARNGLPNRPEGN